MKETLKDFFEEDENIPQRFAMWNAVLFGCGCVLLMSNKVWIKAACIALEGLGAFKMNGEMAKFMNAVLNGSTGRTKIL